MGLRIAGMHEASARTFARRFSGRAYTMKQKILVVDDDQAQCDLLEAMLCRLGYEVQTTTSPHEALEQMGAVAFDAVLTDLGMSEMDGVALCERMLGTQPGLPVLVVTAHGSLESAVSAMRAGAYDFLVKPVDSKLLAISVLRAVQHHDLSRELRTLRSVVASAHAGLIVGEGPATKRMVDLIARVGPTDASVLVQGETGTGKELVARAIHRAATHRKGAFVAINCAAVPASLLESELFGHAKGAFTDAKQTRQGLFLEASGGTLFLDEIGDMPLEMQAKLLRVLQERKVRPVGSNVEVPFDVRLVTATHRDLEQEVKQHRFREDLYYRVHVVRVDVPPLRERGSDVLRLTDHFLQKAATRAGGSKLSLSAEAAERLLAYDWPGNIRELENCVERAVALTRFSQLSVEDLPEKIRAYHSDSFALLADEPSDILSLAEIERRYIHRVIKLLGGNKARAAQLLGVDRRTLYRKLEKYQAHAAHTDPFAPRDETLR